MQRNVLAERSLTCHLLSALVFRQKTAEQRSAVQEKNQKELGVEVEQLNGSDGSGSAAYSLRARRELMSFRSVN